MTERGKGAGKAARHIREAPGLDERGQFRNRKQNLDTTIITYHRVSSGSCCEGCVPAHGHRDADRLRRVQTHFAAFAIGRAGAKLLQTAEIV